MCSCDSCYAKSASVASSPSSSRHGRIALAPKETPLSSQHGISREQLLRGIKVGTAGAVGATLFALTGGLAAPGSEYHTLVTNLLICIVDDFIFLTNILLS